MRSSRRRRRSTPTTAIGRVAALLALGDRTRPPPFDVARVLATYTEAIDDPLARDLLIPRGKWWASRLAELAREAQARLERFGAES